MSQKWWGVTARELLGTRPVFTYHEPGTVPRERSGTQPLPPGLTGKSNMQVNLCGGSVIRIKISDLEKVQCATEVESQNTIGSREDPGEM